jgi:hypothetical protein
MLLRPYPICQFVLVVHYLLRLHGYSLRVCKDFLYAFDLFTRCDTSVFPNTFRIFSAYLYEFRINWTFYAYFHLFSLVYWAIKQPATYKKSQKLTIKHITNI